MATKWADDRAAVRQLLVSAATRDAVPAQVQIESAPPVPAPEHVAVSYIARPAVRQAVAEAWNNTEDASGNDDPGEFTPVLDVLAAELESLLSEGSAEDGELDSADGENEDTPVDGASRSDEARDKALSIIEARRAENDTYLKTLGKKTWQGFSFATALAAIWALELWRAVLPGAVHHSGVRIALVETVVGAWFIFGILVVLNRHSGGLRRLIIGKDGRFSTSLTQAALWTIALFYAIGYLYLRTRATCGASCDYSKAFHELDASYLILLGGPFAAAAAARASVSAKVADGTQQKSTAAETSISDVVTSDAGVADLSDTQFFLFNVLALVFFFVAFTNDPTKLPNLPQGLVALTSVAALTYATNKAIARNAPVVTTVSKVDGAGPIRPGDIVELRGANFIPPGAEDDEFLTLISVKFGGIAATLAPRDVNNVGKDLSPTRLRVRVPEGIEAGVSDVVVTTAADATSAPMQVTIVADQPRFVSAAPLPLRPGHPVTIAGQFFFAASFDAAPVVRFGDVTRESRKVLGQHRDGLDRISVVVPGGLDGTDSRVVVQSLSGATSPAVSLPVGQA